MRKIVTLVTLISIVGLLFAIEAIAQESTIYRRSGIWTSGTQYARVFNPSTVETITGEVVSINRIKSTRGMYSGLRLILITDKETLSVHLGPEWFFEKQNIKVKQKDKIEVRGSRVTFSGKPVIIASEIKKGGSVLKLRDRNGIPQWSGWRRR